MNSPLVTVICNCYNHAPYIIEAIQSVEQQTYKNIELIILNNGSQDNSQKTIEEYLIDKPHIKLVNWKKSQPVTVAFNRMVALSKGDYLIDLAGDDILLPHCIESQLQTFSQHDENVGMVFGNTYLVNEKGEKQAPFFEIDEYGKVTDKGIHHTDYLRILDSGKKICSVSAMMKRSHFETLGGYDEDLFFEDLDYWFRLARKYKIVFIDDFLVDKRVLPHSLGTQMEGKDELTKKIHSSVYKIYHQAINHNTPSENQMLLRRIHYSMHNSFSNHFWIAFLKYSYLELKCRWKIYSSL